MSIPTNFEPVSGIRFDFSRLTAESIGERCGVVETEWEVLLPRIKQVQTAIENIRTTHQAEAHAEPVRFLDLPYQYETDDSALRRIESFAADIRGTYENVIAIGIGGSYLGIKVLFDALAHPYHNELSIEKRNGPKLYFAGENIEPARLTGLLDAVDIKKTHIIITSKSGGTAEPSATLMWLHKRLVDAGGDPKRQITAITDPVGGALKKIAEAEGWQTFAVPDGIGGRWTVLAESTLVFAAILTIDIRGLLRGAASVDKTTRNEDPSKNPALVYAALSHLGARHGLNIGVLMPYSSRLKALSEWYVQLLAESLGKEKDRKGNIVNAGRTPLVAVGTTDMHAQTQQHREGAYDKMITFVKIDHDEANDIVVPDAYPDFSGFKQFVGHSLQTMLNAALSANERALQDVGRASCRIELSELNAESLGALLFFFELATAYEAEFLDVNAFDQPGVEAYKKYLKEFLAVQKS